MKIEQNRTGPQELEQDRHEDHIGAFLFKLLLVTVDKGVDTVVLFGPTCIVHLFVFLCVDLLNTHTKKKTVLYGLC